MRLGSAEATRIRKAVPSQQHSQRHWAAPAAHNAAVHRHVLHGPEHPSFESKKQGCEAVNVTFGKRSLQSIRIKNPEG